MDEPIKPIKIVKPVTVSTDIEFWKIWNSKKCKKSCCFEGLGSLF